MTSPLISVLMPVYNAERYLPAAIESVLDQTMRDFEFLIFDDGSTDGSRALIEHYASSDERIRFISGDHFGYVKWLNIGIEMASSDIVARMDADDICLPHRFERQFEFLRDSPACVALGSQTRLIDADGDEMGYKRCLLTNEEILPQLFDGGLEVIVHPASMIRRPALLEIGGYRAEMEPIEDFDLWLRLSEVGELANHPEALLLYRQHHESVSVVRVLEQKKHASRIFDEARARRGLPSLALTGPEELSAAERHRYWADWAVSAECRGAALKHLTRSLIRNPIAPGTWFVALRLFSRYVMPSAVRRRLAQVLIHRGRRVPHFEEPAGKEIPSDPR